MGVKLGGTTCARGRRAVKVGAVRRTDADKKLAQQNIVSRVHNREKISQVRIIIFFPT